MKSEQVSVPVRDIWMPTGHEMLRFPEWTTQGSEGAYHLNVSVIAGRIIQVRAGGCLRPDTLERGYGWIDGIRRRYVQDGRPFAMIEDMSELHNIPRNTRILFSKRIRSLPGLAVLILCNVSLLHRFLVRVGAMVDILPFSVLVARDETQAVRLALQSLKADDPLAEGLPQAPTGTVSGNGELKENVTAAENGEAARRLPDASRPESRISWSDPVIQTDATWRIQTDGLSSTFQVINGMVLHSISSGVLREDELPLVTALRDRVCREALKGRDFDYFLVDISQIESGHRAVRKHYFASVIAWHRQHPLKALVVYGINRSLRLAISMISDILPLRILCADNLNDALGRIRELESKNEASGAEQPSLLQPADTSCVPERDVQTYVREVLDHLVGFSWDGQYPVFDAPAPSDHPFQPVFEAIHTLNLEFRNLVDEIRNTESRLRMAERLESVGLLASGVAHDFNNLLMGIVGHISLLKISGTLSPSQLARIADIESLVNRASGLTHQLLGFARAGKAEMKPVRLDALMLVTADMLGRTHKGIRIHHRYSPDIWWTEADQGQIDQVLVNLFINAAKAMPHGGDLRLEADNITLNDVQAERLGIPPGNYVRMTICDTGVGIPADVLPRIFDPFFSTRENGEGNGLGLASVYGIVKNHGGAIDVRSEPGKGACFFVYLPAVSGCAAPAPVCEKTPAPAASEGGCILLVDDEETIQEVVRLMLSHLGYEVILASDGHQAIQIYQERAKDIDLVILDMIMPGMMGDETLAGLQAVHPDVRVLLASGFRLDHQNEAFLKSGRIEFIQKPFQMETLSRGIGNLMKDAKRGDSGGITQR